MRKSKDGIPDEVLKEIFPKKLSGSQSSDEVYAQLNKMILSGKLKKGLRLIQDEIVQWFNLNKATVSVAFSRLKKEKLIITKREIAHLLPDLYEKYVSVNGLYVISVDKEETQNGCFYCHYPKK